MGDPSHRSGRAPSGKPDGTRLDPLNRLCTRIPSFVHGTGRFITSLPDEPISELFALNFTSSLWHRLTANLTKPDDVTSFIHHLKHNTDIQRHDMNLERFNRTIQKYQTLRNQLPAYHPLRWISHPKAQMSGFTILLMLCVTIGVVLGVRIWKMRRKLKRSSAYEAEAPSAGRSDRATRRLIRVRRVRRPTIAEATV